MTMRLPRGLPDARLFDFPQATLMVYPNNSLMYIKVKRPSKHQTCLSKVYDCGLTLRLSALSTLRHSLKPAQILSANE